MKSFTEWLDIHRERIRYDKIKTKKTYIVLGVKRGGTSMLAGTLRILGVYMGNMNKNVGGHEDVDISDQNLEDMIQTVIRRNMEHEVWGFKNPAAIDYIYYLLPFLIKPTFLVIFRDPCATAMSESIKHNNNFTQSFWEAMDNIRKLHYFAMYPDAYVNKHGGQVFSISYEKMLMSTETSVRELCELTGLEYKEEVLDFIKPGYRAIPEDLALEKELSNYVK